MSELSILHYARSGVMGGVESLLVPLLHHKTAVGISHHLLLKGERIHPQIREALMNAAASVDYLKSWKGIKIPQRPRRLRCAHINRVVHRSAPDIVLIWDRLDDEYVPHIDFGPSTVIHYEHCKAWTARDAKHVSAYLKTIDGAICCSYAAQRMLQLRWGLRCPVTVCRNGVQGNAKAGGLAPRASGSDTDRPFRLGIAARLAPGKGISLALHALAELLRKGYECELLIAGTGREEENLREMCRRLGIQQAVTFFGLVADMPAFYSDIDLILVPSIHEAFGLVCLEAAMHGCPSIATNIDGLPETLIDGQTGVLIEPELPLEDYPAFGGSLHRIPPFVYCPVNDTIQRPGLPDPARIAAAIMSLMGDSRRLSQMGDAAQIYANELKFSNYPQRLFNVLEGTTCRKGRRV